MIKKEEIKTAVLLRLETSVEDGTLGVIYVDGRIVCFTLEPPMNHNNTGTSCIPADTYDCVKDNTGRHKWFKVLDVPNRKNIEGHTGNSIRDTEGCILTGQSVGKLSWLDGRRGVLNSEVAMVYLLRSLGNPKKFKLEIRNMFVV